MAKKTVSTRLLRPLAEQVDRYAETHDLSRTEALTLFVREGLEVGDDAGGERTYTGLVSQESVDQTYGEIPSNSGIGRSSVSTYIEFGLSRLAEREPMPGEEPEEVARSARMPPDLVGRLDERADSQDSSRAVVAAEVIERGLRADPVPTVAERDRTGRSYTVELDAETAELFRRYRLGRMLLPGEVFERAMGWAGASRPEPVYADW